MGTWINGASVDRAKPQHLPPVTPTPKPAQPRMGVQETIRREVQHQEEEKQRGLASGFLDKFLRLFADYSHHTGRSHKRKLGAASTRSAKEITSEVTAFYAKRPRPWRPAGKRPKPVHAARFKYRRRVTL